MTAPDALDFVTADDDEGTTLAAALRRRTGLAWSAVRAMVASGRVCVDGRVDRDDARRMRSGQRVTHDPRARATRPVDAASADASTLDDARVLFCDPHLIVVDKPSGVNSVPFEEGERGALSDRVRVWLRRKRNAGPNPPVFVVHRIDRDTSGALVFARTWLAQRHLAGLFRAHAIERAYLGLCDGHLGTVGSTETIDTVLIADRGDRRRGSARGNTGDTGQRAITHVRPRAHLRGPSSLVECRLETGRTHQIRIHLAERGHPLLGEDVYARRGERRRNAPRIMLHAGLLAFPHPVEREGEVRVSAAVPEDFATLARELGAAPDALLLR